MGEPGGGEVIDFWNLIVREKFNKPSGWQWCKLDAHNKPEDFVEVTGGVPIGKVSRGARKGSTKWGKDLETFFVRQADMEKARMKWEAENGICSTCEGQGVFGYQKRTCHWCNGTGKPRGKP